MLTLMVHSSLMYCLYMMFQSSRIGIVFRALLAGIPYPFMNPHNVFLEICFVSKMYVALVTLKADTLVLGLNVIRQVLLVVCCELTFFTIELLIAMNVPTVFPKIGKC